MVYDNIICPYCFHRMKDSEVHFRSERFETEACDALPDEFMDIEDFRKRYKGNDKERIQQKLDEWDFFKEGEDQRYEEFWSRFGGTTEDNPADQRLGVKAFRRRIIDPNNPTHQAYLKKQEDGSYFIRDAQGMISQIELCSGEKCNRRVCSQCHNPLPDGYGKFDVKFVSVIGITNAGKTVYLSQLLSKMRTYTAKVGLDAQVTTPSVRNFIEKNVVAAGTPLPGSTPADRFQQPLFYDLVRDEGNGQKSTDTFVMYDVAGEVFEDAELVKRFAPFIEHANGLVVLIDPLQFSTISGIGGGTKHLQSPTQALEAIAHEVSHGELNEKCDIPVAVCISKVDIASVQSILNDTLKNALREDVHTVLKSDGMPETTFDAQQYAPIGKELRRFIGRNELALNLSMNNNYNTYAYFAFTALGCPVVDQNINGEMVGCPQGPVLPKRLEEPLLWMFHKLGYINRNGEIPGEIVCPNCHAVNKNYELPKEEQTIVKKVGFLGLRREETKVNRVCRNCQHRWWYQE